MLKGKVLWKNIPDGVNKCVRERVLQWPHFPWGLRVILMTMGVNLRIDSWRGYLVAGVNLLNERVLRCEHIFGMYTRIVESNT